MTMRWMLVVFAASCAIAQEPARIEVASIRPYIVQNPAGDNSSTNVKPGGRLVCRNVTVEKLIRNSFLLTAARILNAPGWTQTTSYDIDAKTAGGVEITRENISGLLLSLLESRFQFRFHREQREMPIYRLEMAKDGVKLKPHPEKDEPSMTVNSNGLTVTFSAKRVAMRDFARAMAKGMERPVEDYTGLTGEYDIDLKWSTEQAGIEGAGPSVFTALQEVGLRLVAGKAMEEVVVVDGVERASEN
jgi:uncharacterized protein (TIGR03435 family)